MKGKNTKAYLALLAVCIVWGTTYLAIRIGVSGAPPFLFAAVRQLLAAALLFAFLLLVKRRIEITRRDAIRQIVPGTLMIALGNGVIAWSEKSIPSGLAALIVSVMPLYVLFINWVAGTEKQRLNGQIILGLVLGLAGVVLIFRDNLSDLASQKYLWSVIVAFLSCFSWAAGTVYAKQRPSQAHYFVNAALQFLVGGIVLALLSVAFDNWSELESVGPRNIMALIYLVTVGSIFAFACYLYAIRHLPTGLASVYAYINPFIAIILGFLILGERLTLITGFAFLTTVTGVYFINRGYSRLKRTAENDSISKAERA